MSFVEDSTLFCIEWPALVSPVAGWARGRQVQGEVEEVAWRGRRMVQRVRVLGEKTEWVWLVGVKT